MIYIIILIITHIRIIIFMQIEKEFIVIKILFIINLLFIIPKIIL